VSARGTIARKRWLAPPALLVALAALALGGGGTATAAAASSPSGDGAAGLAVPADRVGAPAVVPADREVGPVDPAAAAGPVGARVIVQWERGADRAERA
jgi:hypothetical protein